MQLASVSELKASLSEYLRRVKAGDEVVVTERGLPIARVTPLASASLGADERLVALERAGLARRGDGALPAWIWEQLPGGKDPNASVVGALLEDRDAR